MSSSGLMYSSPHSLVPLSGDEKSMLILAVDPAQSQSTGQGTCKPLSGALMYSTRRRCCVCGHERLGESGICKKASLYSDDGLQEIKPSTRAPWSDSSPGRRRRGAVLVAPQRLTAGARAKGGRNKTVRRVHCGELGKLHLDYLLPCVNCIYGL